MPTVKGAFSHPTPDLAWPSICHLHLGSCAVEPLRTRTRKAADFPRYKLMFSSFSAVVYVAKQHYYYYSLIHRKPRNQKHLSCTFNTLLRALPLPIAPHAFHSSSHFSSTTLRLSILNLPQHSLLPILPPSPHSTLASFPRPSD